MAVDERRRSVVFAEEAAVDVVESVAGNEPVPAGGTRETLEMVDVALCPHHQLAGRDGLTAGTAGAAVSK